MTSALTRTYSGLWAATLLGLILGLTGVALVAAPAPHDALPSAVRTAAGLAAHNLPVVLWPIGLAAIGWQQHRGTRIAGDVLVLAHLIGHGLLVGGALAQQPSLWRYLPHLPIEWLAVALGAAAWLASRDASTAPRYGQLAATAAAAVAATIVAAVLETWAVPL